MFTTTPGNFLSLHSISNEDFLGLIGCSRFIGEPKTTMFTVLYNLFSIAHASGLIQDIWIEPDLKPYLTDMVKIAPDFHSVFLREHRNMFERGIEDRTNIRYVVMEDVDYCNYELRGLFRSLGGANQCGNKLVAQGVKPINLKLEVMLDQP